jgi:hypothetical protein
MPIRLFVQYMWCSNMTLKIEWSLDESDELAQESLLGDITISDGVHSIEEQSVYLDSWLNALIREIERVETIQGIKKIEIAEESQPLTICREADGGIVLCFKEGMARADSARELTSELQRTLELFLQKVRTLKDINQNTLVCSIQDFLARQGDGPRKACEPQ